tara:strand:- start:5828 stop:6745 length:918 start_codon:yes stop_codon:yes gene_type:complete
MKIAVVGSYGVGLTMRVPKVPAPGETVSGGEFNEGPGGKGSNQAIGAARLGAEVSFLTAIGDDDFGKSARSLWRAEGVNTEHVVTAQAATMVGFILVDPSGENCISIAPGALAELTPDSIEPFRTAISEADVLVVSMEIPLPVVGAALRIGRELGTRTLLNPAPAQPLPDELWPLIDVITPNQTEAPVLLGLAPQHGLNDEELIRELRKRTGGVAIITRGGSGALISDVDGITEVAARRVDNVVDTTGAGDSFTAALAVALSEGQSLTAAASFAAVAGAHTVTIGGVIAALPTRTQLDSTIGSTR